MPLGSDIRSFEAREKEKGVGEIIRELYEAIAQELKAVRECPVYREIVPTPSERPFFLIRLDEQSCSQGINKRRKYSLKFCVQYYPQNTEAGAGLDECWEIGETLGKVFYPKGYKVKNRNLKISENILHFTFAVDCREAEDDGTPKMQGMSQNSHLKEE